MVTGRMAFPGQTTAAIHDAILNRQPLPVSSLNPDLPPRIGEIIDKALEKDREVRYQTASDLRADLKRLKRDSESGRAATAPAVGETSGKLAKTEQMARKWMWVLAGVVLLLLIAIGVTWLAKRRVQPQPPLELKETRLTSNPSESGVGGGSISPDGKYLAYADWRGLYLKLIESGELRKIPQPEGSSAEGTKWDPIPWFPDGARFLATRYDAAQNFSTWVVSVLGGPPRLLRDNAREGRPSPDGSQIVYCGDMIGFRSSELWIMGAQGENPHKFLTAPEGDLLSCQVWSPDGQRIAYMRYHRNESSIESQNLKGGELTTILSDPRFLVWGLWWFGNGRLIFTAREQGPNQNDFSLWEIQVDPATGRPLDLPRRITKWPGTQVAQVLNGTTDGKRLAVLKGAIQRDVFVGELEAKGRRLKNPRRLTFDERNDVPWAWTRDSQAVLFFSDRNGQWDIFKHALDQETAEPVVTAPGDKYTPVLSPDCSWILYSQDVAGGNTRKIMRVPTLGGAPEMVLEGKGIGHLKCSFLPATLCVLAEMTPDRKQYILTEFDPIKGRGRELTRVSIKQPDDYYCWDLTRDGSHLAFAQNLQGSQTRIQILPLSGGAAREVVIQREIRMTSLAWANDGKGFYIGSSDGALLFVDMNGNADVLWKREAIWIVHTAGIPSPDGRRLAIDASTTDSNVWMLENF